MVMHFKYSNVYISIPTQSLPLVTISLFSRSVSLFLFYFTLPQDITSLFKKLQEFVFFKKKKPIPCSKGFPFRKKGGYSNMLLSGIAGGTMLNSLGVPLFSALFLLLE